MCASLTNSPPEQYQSYVLVLFLCLLVPPIASAQQQSPPTTPHRTRLILKDGTYQVVMSYRTVGSNVLYVSAERGGAEEVIPARLVDLAATHLWEQRHAAVDSEASQQSTPKPAIDPELLKEEADRASYTPEVAPDLSLPEQDSVLALDTFQGTPELVPMPQSSGDLNHNTAHNVLRGVVNPLAASHQVVQLRGIRSPVQLHVPDPVLYIRMGNGPPSGTGTALTVDTHGATGAAPSIPAGSGATSRYVIVRADVRTDARIIASFNVSMLGSGHAQEDVVEAATDLLPGGHWLRLTPPQPLVFGEYALMEIISDREINLGVWDFGIHPVAPENRDAIKPEPKRPFNLERRRPD